MPISEHERRMLDEIRVKCREILDSTSIFDRSKIFDISSLAYHFDYMEIHRRAMLRWFKCYDSWKRQSKKNEAWFRMRSEIYALNGLANMESTRDQPAPVAPPYKTTELPQLPRSQTNSQVLEP